MTSKDFIVRLATRLDQKDIANLIYFESYVHRHLDWRSPLEWLGTNYYWVVEVDQKLSAVLACPPDPDRIAWVRLFACSDRQPVQKTWQSLWEAALEQLSDSGKITAAVISLQEWLRPLLESSGFSEWQRIIMLEWEKGKILKRSRPEELTVRMMTPDDIDRVAEIDASAFEPLWQNSLSTLKQAFTQAGVATVAELDGQLIGYQITTHNPFGGHLARLAVQPESQRLGIGSALVTDLLEQLTRRNFYRLTVNTQGDNQLSLKLYQRFGFQLTGESYPVYVLEI